MLHKTLHTKNLFFVSTCTLLDSSLCFDINLNRTELHHQKPDMDYIDLSARNTSFRVFNNQ